MRPKGFASLRALWIAARALAFSGTRRPRESRWEALVVVLMSRLMCFIFRETSTAESGACTKGVAWSARGKAAKRW